MNRLTALLCFLLFPLALPAAPTHGSADDEAALLLAWEKVQAADPKTLVFERTAPRLYRFKTERFPYDGSLQVTSVVIQPAPPSGDVVSGMVEVRLDEPNNVLREQFPMSFALWGHSNSLMKDVPTDRWLTFSEWNQVRQQRLASVPWWRRGDTAALAILIGLGVVLVAAVAAAVRYQLATTRKLREEEIIRKKLLAGAGSVTSRDTRILLALEQQRRFIAEALSGARPMKRWRAKWRSERQMTATPVVVEFTPNPLQRERLELYRSLRDLDDARPFLYSQKIPPRTWIASAVVLPCLAGLWMLGAMKAFAFVVGLALGFVLMALTMRESFAQLWPGLRQVLDWRKVEAHLKEPPGR